VLVDYFGWNTANDKMDLKSKLSVFPDEYYVKHTLTPSKSTSGICTGIVKLKNLELIKAESTNKKWAYIATYGPQSMFSDNLGMAVFYSTSTVESLVDGVDDHLIVFKPSNQDLTFYFLGAWEKEKAGFKSQEDFISYLNKQLVLLNNFDSLPVLENEKNIVISDSMKWSKRMALSIMKRHPEAYQIDEQKAPKWDYVHGLVLTSLEKLYQKSGDNQYYDYIKKYADALIDANGTIKTYKFDDYNIDMITAGRLLFHLYSTTKEVKYLEAMKVLRKQISEQPRTSEGGFWHKKRYPNQMWLDGLYMGEPFYAQYTTTFENGKQLNDVAKQFELIQKHATDPKTGLLYHAWDESKLMAWANKDSGTSPNFWSRSIGWYAMALVDALDYFPKNHPKRKGLVGYLNSLAVALDKAKDEKSGLWYQVTDQGNREGNYLESSGSAMFIYALNVS
jgi:unsaturated rhamnogalacturonyl hydrolase